MDPDTMNIVVARARQDAEFCRQLIFEPESALATITGSAAVSQVFLLESSPRENLRRLLGLECAATLAAGFSPRVDSCEASRGYRFRRFAHPRASPERPALFVRRVLGR